MWSAFWFGFIAQAPLILGGLVVYWYRVPVRIVGWLGGFGVGALVSAIAYDLVKQADVLGTWNLATWLLIGAAVFVGLDYLVEKRFGEQAGALGIVLGSIIDGVAESVIFGIGLAAGTGYNTAFLTAVMISNLPQSIAPSADLADKGWKWAKTAGMWLSVVVICGVTAAVSYYIRTLDPTDSGAHVAALAAGGLLAMLTNSLIPFSFERGGLMTGFWAVVGFALSLVQQ